MVKQEGRFIVRTLGRSLFAAAVVSLLIFPAPARAQKKLNTSYAAISGAMAVPWIGVEEGIFKKNGLDVSLVYIASGPKSLAAVLAGETPIALSSGQSLVQAHLRGSDIVSIADHAYTFVFSLMTKPEITKPEQLRGKKLGVTRFGSSTHMGVVKALEHFKLRPVQDVAVLQIGGVPEILAAILSGNIDGGIVSPPTDIRAKKLGLYELLDLGTLQIPFQQSTVITTASYARANPDMVRAYVKSFVDGVAFGKNNKNATKRIIAKYTKVNDDETLEGTYQLFIVKYLKRAPYPSEAAIQTVLDDIGEKELKARSADPKEFVDPRWIKELDDSGYIANLYKK